MASGLRPALSSTILSRGGRGIAYPTGRRAAFLNLIDRQAASWTSRASFRANLTLLHLVRGAAAGAKKSWGWTAWPGEAQVYVRISAIIILH